MRILAITPLLLCLVAAPAPAAGLPLPSKDALLKTLRATDEASLSLMAAYPGPHWEYFLAPLSKLDSTALANPLTAAAAMLANTVIDEGVRVGTRVVSFQYLGEHGWELVTLHNGTAYFKRPKVEPPLTAGATPSL